MADKVIDRIHGLERFGSVLGLQRLKELLARLGNPQEGLRCIHVAGTNGKGSICSFLERGLDSCGYRVGLYISPFIEVFNERIQCGGEFISDEDLDLFGNKALDQTKAMVEDGWASPTEFEVVMAIAFLYFADKKPDIVVLETGLGGIGDATNVIRDPLACIISTISMDHMDVLGDTLEEIAENKAGIIKDRAPVISNVKERGPSAVIARKAYAAGSRFYDMSSIPVSILEENPVSQRVSMNLWGTDYSDIRISMVGEHQAENLKTALGAIEVLRQNREITIERSALYRGLEEAGQAGRFEIVRGRERWSEEDCPGPAVILDGAHNEAGAEALKKTMKRFFPREKILLVTGMLRDKDVERILDHLTGITKDIIATEPDSPRKLSAVELSAKLERRGIAPLRICDRPEESVKKALSEAGEYDAILFAGSLYLISTVRRLIKNGQ